MLTREEHGTRLAEGLAQVRSLLAEVPHADVEVRTLGDPWQVSARSPTRPSRPSSPAPDGRQPAAPPAALLRRDSLHWLLTDGADAALFEWPGDSRPDRIVQVAGVTRNVGLERLSARRSLNDPERYDVSLKVANGGTALGNARRRLRHGRGRTRPIESPPGARRIHARERVDSGIGKGSRHAATRRCACRRRRDRPRPRAAAPASGGDRCEVPRGA